MRGAGTSPTLDFVKDGAPAEKKEVPNVKF